MASIDTSLASLDLSAINSAECGKICVPIVGKLVEEMFAQMAKAKASGADLVEIRLDYLRSFFNNNPRLDLESLIKQFPDLPKIVSYRPKWERGHYEGDESTRLDALRLAMELGADYIDIELKVAHEFIDSIREKKPEKFKVIVSYYNYQNTPSLEDITKLVRRMQDLGADIVKIVTTALDVTDVARIFQVTATSQVPVIGVVMGERGLPSQILCRKFGGYLTYSALEAEHSTDKGQRQIDDLLNTFNYRQIKPNTKVSGLMGNPVSHSKSSVFFNKAYKEVGFNGVYLPYLVDDVPKFLEAYNSPEFVGFSCTLPHKEKLLRRCDEVDPVAKAIGAVNTVVRRPSDGKFIGYNTDYFGAISAIEIGLRDLLNIHSETGSPLAGKLVAVIGAGGAGKAIAYGAKAKGARVVIANRTYERARVLAESIGGKAIPLAELENYQPEEGTVLANCTSVGMQPKVDESPIPKHALKRYALVFDAVYTPKMTKILQDAQESGIPIVTGVDMFIIQAYEQFERFTNLPAPKELLWEIMSGY